MARGKKSDYHIGRLNYGRELIPVQRVVVCGSRAWRKYQVLYDRLSKFDPQATRMFSGGARGADLMARRIAEKIGIPFTEIHAQWEVEKDGSMVYDPNAGFVRNGWLLDKLRPNTTDLVIACRAPGPSPGTDWMIHNAPRRGLKLEVIE